MEHKLPSWLNETFLKTVLQGKDGKESSLRILRFSAKPAVAAGNNYGSNLYRVHVEYEDEQSGLQSESLIVKAAIEKGVINEVSQKYFSTESKIYNELLPKIYDKIKCNFGPKFFFSPVINRIVLKDMVSEGYITCDKFKQLDFSHCKHVVLTLAKFHATCVACHHDDPVFIEKIGDECLYTEGGLMEHLKPWLKASVKRCAEILMSMDGQQQIACYVSSRVDHIWDSVVEICKPKPGRFSVLNHGDCWLNNIMFKHNESSEIMDVKLIDYQIPRFASPVVDLTYFIWTSANEEVRASKQQELFRIYLQTLNKTLQTLGCKEGFSAEEFQEDLNSVTDWILITICYELPLMICEAENGIDMEDIDSEVIKNIGTDDRFLKLYCGKTYSALFPMLMKQFQACLTSQSQTK